MIWDNMAWYLTILFFCGIVLLIYEFVCILYPNYYSEILNQRNINPANMISIGIAFIALAISWNSALKNH